MKKSWSRYSFSRFGVVLLAGVLVSACGDKNEFQAPPPPLVGVAKPSVEKVTRYAEYTGSTSALKTVEIKPKVTGYLQDVKFKDGQMVKKGDLLFVIDPRTFEAQVEQAEGNLANAKAQYELAQATLERNEAALKDNAVSEIQVLQAKASRDSAKAQIKTNEGALADARVNLIYCYIRSPIDGRISRRMVDAGNLVTDATQLASVVSVDPMYAYFNINERDLLSYLDARKNQGTDTPKTFEMGLSNNDSTYPIEGTLDYIGNQVDAQTGTISMRGVFANPKGDVYPGLFAKVRLPVEVLPNALVVPEEAMAQDQRGDYVLVVKGDGTVEYRSVKKGSLEAKVVDGAQRQYRVVLEGLKADDDVVVQGTQKARPGSKVTPKSVAEMLAIEKQKKEETMKAAEKNQSGKGD